MCVMWDSTCGTNTVNVQTSLAVSSPSSGVHTSKSCAGTVNMMSDCHAPSDRVCHEVHCGKSPVCVGDMTKNQRRHSEYRAVPDLRLSETAAESSLQWRYVFYPNISVPP